MALDVHVVTPEREVWAGPAEIVIARGVEGEVGILSGHAPLLIRLAIGPLRIRHEGAIEYAVVDGGFLHVTSSEGATRVDVLAEQRGHVGVAYVVESDGRQTGARALLPEHGREPFGVDR